MTLFHQIVKNQILRKLRTLKSYFQRENQRVKFGSGSSRFSRTRRMVFRLVSPLIMTKSMTRGNTLDVGYVSRRSPLAPVSLLIARDKKSARREIARQRRGRPFADIVSVERQKFRPRWLLSVAVRYKATPSCVPQ